MQEPMRNIQTKGEGAWEEESECTLGMAGQNCAGAWRWVNTTKQGPQASETSFTHSPEPRVTANKTGARRTLCAAPFRASLRSQALGPSVLCLRDSYASQAGTGSSATVVPVLLTMCRTTHACSYTHRETHAESTSTSSLDICFGLWSFNR